MHYLIYISTAVNLMTDDELKDILSVSRKNNLENDITGMLLYCEGTFIQLLEGNKNAIDSTYQTIEQDKRHKNLIKLMTGETEKRTMPEWTMGFASADKKILNQIEGYTDPANPDFLQNNQQTTPLIILKTFAENNRISAV